MAQIGGTMRRLVVLGLVVGGTGCTSWQVQTIPPAEVIARPKPPRTVRITTRDGQSFNLSDPHLAGDSMLGLFRNKPAGVSVGAIRDLATRHFNTRKTVVSTGLTLMLVWVAAFAAADGL